MGQGTKKATRGSGSAEVRESGFVAKRIYIKGSLKETGRRAYRRITAKSQKELRKLEAEVREQMELGVSGHDGREPLTSYLDRWIEQWSANKEPSTIYAKQTALRHVKRLIGHIELSALKPQHFKQIFDATAIPSTDRQHTVYESLKMPLRDAVFEGVLARNPMDRFRTPPRSKRQPKKVLTPVEAALLMSVMDDQDATLTRFLLATGARIGEALALTWNDCDLDERIIEIRRTVYTIEGRMHVRDGGKTATSRRDVVIEEGTANILRAHRQRQIEQRLKADTWTDKDLLFTNTTGDYRITANFSYQLKSAARVVDIDPARVHPHGLRHCHASWALSASKNPDGDLVNLAKRLGHATPSTTLGTYAHAMPGRQTGITSVMTELLDAEKSAG